MTTKVVLVHIDFVNAANQEDPVEFRVLAQSVGAEIVATITGMRNVPDPKLFIGGGKADEVRMAAEQADLVLFNHALSPSQERNLERILQRRVLDRTGLILDIFAQRARTFEGKLQVELAQLTHLATRLVRGWTHLERQKGGIGLRGPGETQLETDRRLIRQRIKTINKRLQKVRQQRDQSRRARHKAAVPTVALIGYTNAGKSSLFNQLTQSDVYVADQLFATLDPTMRSVNLPGAGKVILSDTVGFIRHLPHDLVQAFSATLEETRDADLLLHIIDIADPNWHSHTRQVESVLTQIDAQAVPQIQVYNKIDLLSDTAPKLVLGGETTPTRVWISVQQQLGLDYVLQAISQELFGDPIQRTVCVAPTDGKLRAQLYALDAVLAESIDKEGNWWLSIRIAKNDFERMFQQVD